MQVATQLLAFLERTAQPPRTLLQRFFSALPFGDVPGDPLNTRAACPLLQPQVDPQHDAPPILGLNIQFAMRARLAVCDLLPKRPRRSLLPWGDQSVEVQRGCLRSRVPEYLLARLVLRRQVSLLITDEDDVVRVLGQFAVMF